MFKIFQYLNITLFLSLLPLSNASANDHLTVLVPNFPPYTFNKDNQISGIGIELANKVFIQAGIKVNYRILPNYAKALYELEQGRGDAVLLISKNDERDNIAVFSKPLMFNRWCWYSRKDSQLNPNSDNFKSDAKISSHFKTNTHKWLTDNNYNVQPVMELSKLPKMLLKARVDAVFIAELVFEEAMKQDHITLQQFNKVVEIEKPFGIYISKNYLAKNPQTLQKVNQAIDTVINY
jgi:ABC-type amino acid transport substrate-binding protein